jgi:PAS domain S-box-containing protein
MSIMHDPEADEKPSLQTPIAKLEQEIARLRRQLAMMLPDSTGNPSELLPEFSEHSRYRALIELSPQIVWVRDAEGLMPYANQYWYDLTGLTVEQTRHGGWARVIHPDEAERIYKEWQRSMAEGTPWETELRIRRASDGEYRWYASRALPIRDGVGKVTGWMGVALDIHDRKIATARMIESDERLRLAVEAGNIGAWDHYLHTDEVVWSPKAQEILGFNGPVPTFGWFIERVHPEDRIRIGERLQKAKNPKIRADYDSDYRFTRPDGTVRWLLSRGKVFFDSESDTAKPIRTAGVFFDITDRKQAEWERALLTATLQHSPDFIAITDLAGKIVFLNRAGQNLVGLPENAEIQSRHIHEFLPPAELQLLRDEILPVVRQHGVWEGRFALQHVVTREAIPSETCSFGIFDTAGKLTNIATVSRDIAEKEKLEEKLRTAQKMEAIGRLAAGIAHDFNNLLTVVRGSAEVLEKRLPANATDLHHSLREIHAAADRASALTDQLLTFGRRQMVFPQVINLNHVIFGMEEMLQRLVGSNATLSFSVDKDLWNVKINPSQVDQLLINFIANARDAMPNGGDIAVKTWNQVFDTATAQSSGLEAGEYVCLSVTDSGIGMDAETLSHIFEPFFTTKELGTGMGLATVYGIVQQCSGHVVAHSAMEKGTEFIIYFPRTIEAISPETNGNKISSHRSGSETILIAEDEPSLRALLADYVRECGYRVLEAASVEEALVAVHNQKLDLLVTDIAMPGGTGQALASALSASYPGLGIIFMSGYADYASLQEAASHPGVMFVPKPFTLRYMLDKIREALHARPASSSASQS